MFIRNNDFAMTINESEEKRHMQSFGMSIGSSSK
jgi:hypothetical protein